MFLSKNYRLIVARRKFDVLKTNISLVNYEVSNRSNMLSFENNTVISLHELLKIYNYETDSSLRFFLEVACEQALYLVILGASRERIGAGVP